MLSHKENTLPIWKQYAVRRQAQQCEIELDLSVDSDSSRERSRSRSSATESQKRKESQDQNSQSDSEEDDDSQYSSENRSMDSLYSLQPKEEQLEEGEIPHFHYRKGEVFKGMYEAESFLADGTFGRVVRVRDKQTETRFAMKIIKAQKRHIDNAQIEVDILEKVHTIEHPGKQKIVKIVDHFIYGDNFCIVFEELGKSLYDTLLMNDFQGFPVSGIRRIMWDVLKGISFMHEIGLTHTDLKPENILFTNSDMRKINRQYRNCTQSCRFPVDYGVKIVDFGGATFNNEHHSTIINTRQYRAPEVILNCFKWDEKSDIWCLGCIAIELYTGDLYFSTKKNDLEHLAMIEKSCGPIPYHMVLGINNNTSELFDKNRRYTSQSCLKWPNDQANVDSINRVKDMKIIEQLISPRLPNFIDLIRKMQVVDPKKRITAKQALDHPFFKEA